MNCPCYIWTKEKKNKYIYDGNTINKVSHINPYLVDYIPDNITIIKHTKNIDNNILLEAFTVNK